MVMKLSSVPLPIGESQSGDALKFFRVVSHQGDIDGQCLPGELKVIGADGISLPLQKPANAGCLGGGVRVKRDEV